MLRALSLLKVPPFPREDRWKGKFHDHTALHAFQRRALHYLEGGAKIDPELDLLSQDKAQLAVLDCFSSLPGEQGISPHSWVCDIFDAKELDPGYLSLRGLWVEMELFWRDPGYNQRCWDELNSCRQGTASAHVYGARFRVSLQKIRNKELNDFQIMMLLISNLSPSAAMYVRERMFERDPSYQRTGMMTSLPMLERVIEWASVRDVSFPSLASQSSSAAVVRTAAPVLAPRGAGRGVHSFPLRTDPSGASRPPLSPAEARERWEKGAL
jgi:hypothetical protein